ncbi:hypothetical protein ADIS_2135 [Lunatimonas lonarensis]|uniref:Outer membrane protein beta-barrel domain-containing protein n=1 Tax=Lunatimonas lonarensis TaxID=1232681 RepID=R7ZT56_9BACT|nr:hypothetical protein [Lunatimonas lonarensis]EON77267.1 hypothetical protein ADIS_2135 [Lunatimonas lonarensis]
MKQFIGYLFLSFLFLAPLSASYAQFAKGEAFIGGGINLDVYTATNSQTRTLFGLQPSIGIFTSSQDAVGISPVLSINSGLSSTYARHSGGVSLFYRRYVTITEKLFFQFGPSMVYLTNLSDEYKFNDLSLRFSPGMTYRPTTRWMFDLSLGSLNYRLVNRAISTTSKNTSRQFTANVSNSGFVTVAYIFTRKNQ